MKVKIPCLVSRTSKGGVTSFYWQPSKTLREAGFTPEALGKDEGKAFFRARDLNIQVDQWKSGEVALPKVDKHRDPGTVAALIGRYRREHVNGEKPDGSPRLRVKTRDVYEIGLKRIDAWAGKHKLASLTPARVRHLRETVARPVDKGGLGHAAAFNLLRVLRQLFAFAEAVDLIPKGTNPATDFGLGKPPARKLVWELEDDTAFDAAAYELGLPSMALARALGLYTAQRESDLLAFTEPQLRKLDIFEPVLRDRLKTQNGRVMGWCLAQQKTSTAYADVLLEIPFEPELLERVEAAIRANRARDRAATPPRLISHVLIDDRTGLPWKQRAFIEAWSKILAHAAERTGRPRMTSLVWHDLRRTRVVRLRRRNMPKEMIAALTGHSLRSIEEMLAVYGPVDPTMTANAIVASLEPRPEKRPDDEKASNKNA